MKVTAKAVSTDKEKSYWKHLVELWSLGDDSWLMVPPLCLITVPIGLFVTAAFTWSYVKCRRAGKPLPENWS